MSRGHIHTDRARASGDVKVFATTGHGTIVSTAAGLPCLLSAAKR
jgi:hypothetical protein